MLAVTMRDLELWRRLEAGDASPAVVALLRELADASPRQRAPFIARIVPLCSSPDAATRAAAVRVLGGSKGIEGLRLLVAGLDDDDAEVRAAAVAGLREVARVDPMRWVHVVFHRRIEVRRLALVDPPPGTDPLWIHLRADPACADLLSGTPWPPGSLGLLLQWIARGELPPALALAPLARCEPTELRTIASTGARRTSGELLAYVTVAGRQSELPPPSGRDVLDTIADVLVRADPDDPQVQRGWTRLIEAMGVPDAPLLRLRTMVAVLGACLRERFSDRAAEVCTVMEPRFLLFDAVPLPCRRQAATALVRHRSHMVKRDTSLVAELLESPLTRLESGGLDIPVVVALASLGTDAVMNTLFSVYGRDTLRQQLAGDRRGWIALCRGIARDGEEPPVLRSVLLLRDIMKLAPTEAAETAAIAIGSGAVRPVHVPTGQHRPALIALARLEAAEIFSVHHGHWPELLHTLAQYVLPLDRETWIDLLATSGPTEVARRIIDLSRSSLPLDDLVAAWADLPDEACRTLLDWLDRGAIELDRATREALASRLQDRDDATLRAFVAGTIRAQHAEPAPTWRAEGIHNLTARERDPIATVDPAGLGEALRPALVQPARGVVEALARRPDPVDADLSACVALVGSVDGLPEIDRELARFVRDDPEFEHDLRWGVLTQFGRQSVVPPLVDAWLSAWDERCDAFAHWIDAEAGELAGVLERTASLRTALLVRTLWSAALTAVHRRRARTPRALLGWAEPALFDLALDRLTTELGPLAARLLVAFASCKATSRRVEPYAERIDRKAPDLDRATVAALEPWRRYPGLPSRGRPLRTLQALPPDDVAELRRIVDVDRVAERCGSTRAHVAAAAARRLVWLGGRGPERLVELLEQPARVPHPEALLGEAAAIGEPSLVARLTAVLLAEAVAPPLRFRLALQWLERGRPTLDAAVRAIEAADADPWLTTDDVGRLLGRAGAERTAVLERLATCRQPAAYDVAVRELLRADPALARRGLLAFLHVGSDRPPALRREATIALWPEHAAELLPLALTEIFDPGNEDALAPLRGLAPELRDRAVESALTATMVGGAAMCTESRALDILELLSAKSPIYERGIEQLLLHGTDDRVRKRISEASWRHFQDNDHLRQLGQIFAWGVRRGRELTGHTYSVHLTAKRNAFGYTPIGHRRIYVTPLPVLQDDRFGVEIVEGLVLHELGHHMYHQDQKGKKVWGRAKREHLFELLNLVADEHLERNLRALDASFGDRIKRLDAYAFQHADREINVTRLLATLGPSARQVLTELPLRPAFEPSSVRIDSGRLLLELDRQGNPFARFVRALRMGLGNRSGDPLVEEALALFGGGFRRLQMPGLLRITRRLAELFGGAAELAKAFGGLETVEWDEREAAARGLGIDDERIQREVERILEPPRHSKSSPGGPARLQINVAGNAEYKKIEQVVRLTPDRAAHQALARDVQRHAAQLRRVLARLGLAHLPRRARLRGRAFDRTRARAVVLRGDPRMLIAREIALDSDLFVGVAIDCSSSMSGACMDKARRFGVLLAEAIAGLPNVDARFFGFTHDRIFDAGDARHCAVTQLQANGGNNDAAGLDYVARVAAGSLRRAKLLVMVSDGLPTECSVEALRALVQQLTRRHKMCCAQVAVRPLTEICFPHYVLLDDASPDASVRRFADVVAKLVHAALAR